LRPLADNEIERSVDAIARLGCSFAKFTTEHVPGRYVAVRHREDDEFLLEFGFAENAPCCSLSHATIDRGLAQGGTIVWNWCCTGRSQPETGLVIRKLREVQAITLDKLLIWDDDGMAHRSWGSCALEESGDDPMAVVDEHLRRLPPDRMAAIAS
jgi:hypothetical protein